MLMRYALIENNIVSNIIELDKQNEQYFPSAVYTGDIPVGIGDAYIDGKFYRNGNILKTPLETASAEINDLTAQLGKAVNEIYNNDMEVINNV